MLESDSASDPRRSTGKVGRTVAVTVFVDRTAPETAEASPDDSGEVASTITEVETTGAATIEIGARLRVGLEMDVTVEVGSAKEV